MKVSGLKVSRLKEIKVQKLKETAFSKFLIGIGGHILRFVESTYDAIDLTFDVIKIIARLRLNIGLTISEIQKLILGSLPLVMITAASTGAVMALQFGNGMARFGGKLYVPTVVSLAVVRALAPVFTGLMVASRSGASVAAELSGMSATQQIDALRALGGNPIASLVAPRVVALALGLPALTLIADLTGIVGGLIVSAAAMDLAPALYLQKTVSAVKLADLMSGLFKSGVFGVLIGLLSCLIGIRSTGGSAGIGRSAAKAVVANCAAVMIGDLVLTKLFWLLKW
jgi:phospholipid/cholesterol/gamma-HCH transport system permease protein